MSKHVGEDELPGAEPGPGLIMPHDVSTVRLQPSDTSRIKSSSGGRHTPAVGKLSLSWFF